MRNVKLYADFIQLFIDIFPLFAYNRYIIRREVILLGENQRDVFVKNLREAMNARGVSQTDIVSALQISTSTVSDWVSGKRYPRIDAMQRLADYLGVLVSDLTREEKPVTVDGLSEREERFLWLYDQLGDGAQAIIEAWLSLSPPNRRILIAVARAILQEQSIPPVR